MGTLGVSPLGVCGVTVVIVTTCIGSVEVVPFTTDVCSMLSSEELGGPN